MPKNVKNTDRAREGSEKSGFPPVMKTKVIRNIGSVYKSDLPNDFFILLTAKALSI
jgi:hypothetical protein